MEAIGLSRAQKGIIAEQHAVLKRMEIDIAVVRGRLNRQIEELQRAADREIQEIHNCAMARCRELGEEYSGFQRAEEKF